MSVLRQRSSLIRYEKSHEVTVDLAALAPNIMIDNDREIRTRTPTFEVLRVSFDLLFSPRNPVS